VDDSIERLAACCHARLCAHVSACCGYAASNDYASNDACDCDCIACRTLAFTIIVQLLSSIVVYARNASSRRRLDRNDDWLILYYMYFPFFDCFTLS